MGKEQFALFTAAVVTGGSTPLRSAMLRGEDIASRAKAYELNDDEIRVTQACVDKVFCQHMPKRTGPLRKPASEEEMIGDIFRCAANQLGYSDE